MEEVERAKDNDMPIRATRSRISMRDSDDDDDDDIDMEGRRGHGGGGGVSFEEFTVYVSFLHPSISLLLLLFFYYFLKAFHKATPPSLISST